MAASPNSFPAWKRRQVERAVKLYRDFTGEEPETFEEMDMPNYDTVICVGTVDGILYTTRRDHKTESYIHEFEENARPLLCVTHDGQAMVILGGGFTFTEAGFVDDRHAE